MLQCSLVIEREYLNPHNSRVLLTPSVSDHCHLSLPPCVSLSRSLSLSLLIYILSIPCISCYSILICIPRSSLLSFSVMISFSVSQSVSYLLSLRFSLFRFLLSLALFFLSLLFVLSFPPSSPLSLSYSAPMSLFVSVSVSCSVIFLVNGSS